MERISLPKWIVPVGVSLGLLVVLFLLGLVLDRILPQEIAEAGSFLVWTLIAVAIVLAGDSFWIAWLLGEGSERGLPLSLVQEGSFPVLHAETRAANEDNIWYFLIEVEKGLRFVSYPYEIVTQEISTAEKGRLEIKRRGEITKITYYHPH